MDVSTSFGPHKRAWLATGYPFFYDDGLTGPRVMVTDVDLPVAAIPSWAAGTPCEDVFFAYCNADLVRQRVGVIEYAARLVRVGAPIASALVAATLALGLNAADGLNAIERMVYQLVRLVG